MLDLPPFPGFRDEAFAFLRALRQHNRRDWFKPRKQTFEDEVWWPMQCLVVDAARRAAEQGLPFAGDPGQALFRIYRDTRFSKNKQPYKTHVGAVLSRSGSRKDRGVLYVHVEPGASFLAAGFYRPEPPFLRAWRERMVHAPAPFLAMRQALAERNLELEAGEDTLKTLPRGFSGFADAEVAAFLRWKSFLVQRPVSEAALQTPAFAETVVAMMQDALPLLRYGWDLEAALRVPEQPAPR